MKITPDTNILLRAIIEDEPKQARQAQSALRDADLIAITLPALCEFVWVLQRKRATPANVIAEAIRRLIDSPRIETNRQAIAAGIAVLEAGRDFADAVIALEGYESGGGTFVTFDKKAARLVAQAGIPAELLK